MRPTQNHELQGNLFADADLPDSPEPITKSPLLIGTSSWTADGWVGSFYPAGTKQPDFLPYYSSRYCTVEIDNTFYAVPSARTVKQWRERTPPGFTFAAKVPQVITHEKVLVDTEGDLAHFLSVMDLLGDKLGPLLIQFPYQNRKVFANLDAFLGRLVPFLEALPKGYRWALEVRNKTWIKEELYAVLRNYRVSLALVDQSWMPRPDEYFQSGDPLTGYFVYVRWLGDRKGIGEQTKVWDRIVVDRTAEMVDWSNILVPIIKRGIPIMIYVNNHFAGFAPGSIELFERIMAEQGQQGPVKDAPLWTAGARSRFASGQPAGAPSRKLASGS